MTLSVSHIIVKESWATLLYRSALVRWGLLAFVYVPLPWQCLGISIRLGSGLWLGHGSIFFSFSVVDFLPCFWSLSFCVIQFGPSCRRNGLTSDSTVLWYTEGFVVNSMTASCLGPLSNPNHHPSATMVDSWYEMFVLMCCVWFYQMWCSAKWPNIYTLVLSV